MMAALAIDAAWGEPPARLHPVVLMGKYLGRVGRTLPDNSPAKAYVGGASAWVLGAVVFTAAAWAVARTVDGVLRPDASWPGAVASMFVDGVLLKPLLAWRLLRTEAQAVEAALMQGVEAGRARVAFLASRDTGGLTSSEVRETAIESLAENLNDSVIAPLFWFAVGGLAGATLYRFANTADAMWGYRGRWEWAGKWSARADDLLSWIPARLTGMALLSPRRWSELSREARRTASPNGGWPMGAMALRLGVRLGKPGVYTLNPKGRLAVPTDSVRAIRLARVAIALCLAPLLVLA
ncbi:MAG: cobalamin biosynthesis protein CobD [Gammaproteobacteria bacterium]|nr:cobalamin biosynthesis protein CobD [Gammaproteobacteria bacterium]